MDGDEAVRLLSADLPGTCVASGVVLGRDSLQLVMRGHDARGELWSERVRIGLDEDGECALFLIAPHVHVGRCGRAVGPTMLRNAVVLASAVAAGTIRATASMNMGRALTCHGLLPTARVWPGLLPRLDATVRVTFPAQVGGNMSASMRLTGPRSVRLFVPDQVPTAGGGPRLAVRFPEKCKSLFMQTSWEASLDLRDTESMALHEERVAALEAGLAAIAVAPLSGA